MICFKMQEDSFPAAEKILTDIELVFKRDPKLEVFEIIPVTSNENKSPVLHVDHCLGLESWSVPHVYTHAYNHVMSIRQNKRKREEYSRVNKLLMGVLMINPEITSFWNMRKDMMVYDQLNPYFELHFTAVILSRKPKCAEIYSHRKWIINNMFKGATSDLRATTNELNICEMAADHYSNNYHAWTHRIWTLSHGKHSSTDAVVLYQREWLWSENWVSSHVSDHSGLQYRQYLLSNIVQLAELPHFEGKCGALVNRAEKAAVLFINSSNLKDCSNDKEITLPFKIVISELLLNTKLIENFPGHEALWCHRRFILFMFRDLLFKSKDISKIHVWGYVNIGNHLNFDGVPLEKDKKIESYFEDKFSFALSIYEEAFLKKIFSRNTRSK